MVNRKPVTLSTSRGYHFPFTICHLTASLRASHALHIVAVDPRPEFLDGLSSDLQMIERMRGIVGLHHHQPGIGIRRDIDQVRIVEHLLVALDDDAIERRGNAACPLARFESRHRLPAHAVRADFLDPYVLHPPRHGLRRIGDADAVAAIRFRPDPDVIEVVPEIFWQFAATILDHLASSGERSLTVRIILMPNSAIAATVSAPPSATSPF